jgi:hypothetical protein
MEYGMLSTEGAEEGTTEASWEFYESFVLSFSLPHLVDDSKLHAIIQDDISHSMFPNRMSSRTMIELFRLPRGHTAIMNSSEPIPSSTTSGTYSHHSLKFHGRNITFCIAF